MRCIFSVHVIVRPTGDVRCARPASFRPATVARFVFFMRPPASVLAGNFQPSAPRRSAMLVEKAGRRVV